MSLNRPLTRTSAFPGGSPDTESTRSIAFQSYWELPGGVVEANESPYAAAVREIGEELGLPAAVGRLLVVVSMWGFRRSMTGSGLAGLLCFDVVFLADNRIGDGGDGRSWAVEHRYRAVQEVLGGAEVAAVARQFGTSRQSLYTWLGRYRDGGLQAPADRSRRPQASPTRTAAELEATICELRRRHPRWGAQRIAFEPAETSGDSAPSRSTVYRVLVRNGLVDHQH